MSDDPANRPPDPYEAKYMQGDGEVLHRDKMKGPWWYALFFLLPTLFVWVVYAMGGSKPAPLWVPLVMTPVFLMIWLLFSVLRVTVTKKKVDVQYGLFGPSIPIESIVSSEEVDYDWTSTSYGIHKGPDGAWVYNMVGDGAHGVKIVYRVGDKQKSVIVGTKGASKIHAAIARARAAESGPIEPARLAGPTEGAAEAVIEEEDEARAGSSS